MPKVNMVCPKCGSTDVVRDAWAEWDVETQEWVLSTVFDHCFCQACEEDTYLDEKEVKE